MNIGKILGKLPWMSKIPLQRNCMAGCHYKKIKSAPPKVKFWLRHWFILCQVALPVKTIKLKWFVWSRDVKGLFTIPPLSLHRRRQRNEKRKLINFMSQIQKLYWTILSICSKLSSSNLVVKGTNSRGSQFIFKSIRENGNGRAKKLDYLEQCHTTF